jgi:mono/diheme cytochrome c family protein
MTFSPDGRYIYVTHILARYQLPTTQIERGWMNTNAMTIIDVSSDKVLTTVLLDDADLGAANPWGAACSEDGKYVCVSHSGSGEISVIDRIQLHEKLDRVSKGQRVSDATSCLADVPNDLSFLSGLRRRIRLEGIGPRNMVLIGSKGYVCEYFSDSIGVFELEPSVTAKAVSLPLGPSLPLTSVRQGEIFFHDASLCFQKWQSCASCHPGDARADSLNWDLLNDGIGNPKNTKSMLYAHPTPPSMMGGVRENAEAAVRAGIRYIQFAIRPDADAAAIDEYLKSLRPLPSPLLVKDSKSGKPVLSESAIRGKQIYEKARCADCHCGPYFTNQKKYDVGTGTGVHQGSAFDTPTLIEVWRTAPYLYDGRAATMKEVLRQFNPDDKHGITSDLTDKEIDQLAEYVLSL